MPVYIPEKEYKIKCPECGTEFYIKIGGYGDAIYRIKDVLKFYRDRLKLENLKCSNCGSRINELIIDKDQEERKTT